MNQICEDREEEEGPDLYDQYWCHINKKLSLSISIYFSVSLTIHNLSLKKKTTLIYTVPVIVTFFSVFCLSHSFPSQ